jgi:transcriptional regulator with XRE-family HTH domain
MSVMAATSVLRKYRTASKMTLEEFGVALGGVNKSTVLRWEKGEIPAERVLPLSKFTGIAPHELRPDIYPRRERAS